MKLWFVQEGLNPTQERGPAYKVPFHECSEIALQWICDLDEIPRMGKQTHAIAGFRHVVAEMRDGEARKAGRKAGWYLLDRSLEDVVAQFGPPATLAESLNLIDASD